MNEITGFKISDGWIESLRGQKNRVDQDRPYAWLVEKERTADGTIEDTGIIFLTNRECPYRCLMCDLWKNTTDEPISHGAITRQVEWALERMPGIRHVKLYNSGSFFDEKAIPPSEYRNIAALLDNFENVIVESHPRLIGEKCLSFRKMLKPGLEIALGLETVHPDLLKKLNKKMTSDDFRKSVEFLNRNGIKSRAFILLRPPFLTESEGIEWAELSIDFAFDAGAGSCTVIPVRAGNGAMDNLRKSGLFTPPDIKSLEETVEYGIRFGSGRVFADLWDLELFSGCAKCFDRRKERLTRMNLYQEISEPVVCTCC